MLYTDAGTGWNNSTIEAVGEARTIWPNRPIGCLVTISTEPGKVIQLNDRSDKKSYNWLLHKLAPRRLTSWTLQRNIVFESLTSCEKMHHDVYSKFPNRVIFDRNYFGCNVPLELSDIDLEEWKKLDDVVAHTTT